MLELLEPDCVEIPENPGSAGDFWYLVVHQTEDESSITKVQFHAFPSMEKAKEKFSGEENDTHRGTVIIPICGEYFNDTIHTHR